MECGLVYATTSAPFELIPLQLLLLLLLPLPFDVIYQMQIWHACHILLNSIDFKSNWNENVSFLLNWFQRENFCQTNFTIEGCQTCVDTYMANRCVCMYESGFYWYVFVCMCVYVISIKNIFSRWFILQTMQREEKWRRHLYLPFAANPITLRQGKRQCECIFWFDISQHCFKDWQFII